MKRMCYVFDIDGTLADNRHRQHLVPKGEDAKDDAKWKIFNDECPYDEPIDYMVDILDSLYATRGVDIVFVTGRSESCRKETMVWLDRNVIEMDYCELFMRPVGDCRPATHLKADLFSKVEERYHIKAAFEDQPLVAEYLTDEGYAMILVNSQNGIGGVV